jgi:hypothetical protein
MMPHNRSLRKHVQAIPSTSEVRDEWIRQVNVRVCKEGLKKPLSNLSALRLSVVV